MMDEPVVPMSPVMTVAPVLVIETWLRAPKVPALPKSTVAYER